MLTFLELYQTLLGFVFYKLFTDINLVYPPALDAALDESGAGIGALLLEENGKGLVVIRGETDEEVERKRVYAKDVRKQIKEIGLGGGDAAGEAEAIAMDEETVAPIASTSIEDVVLDVFPSLAPNATELAQPEVVTSSTNLFGNYFFYLSREVTRPTLEFVIRSFSGQVGWDAVLGAGSPYLENDPRITHHIVDRPVVPGTAPRSHPGKRAYIQPQWVVDCLNLKKLLPTEVYAPGATLPPHLSPFVDEDEVRERGGYVPMDSTRADLEMEDLSDSDADEDEADEEEGDKAINYAGISSKLSKKAPALLLSAKDPSNATLLHAAELEAEGRGITATQFEQELAGEIKKVKKALPKKKMGTGKVDRTQEEQLASIMLTGKQKKLYSRMVYSKDRRAEEVRPLPFLSRTLWFSANELGRRRSWSSERRRSRRRRRGSRRPRVHSRETSSWTVEEDRRSALLL